MNTIERLRELKQKRENETWSRYATAGLASSSPEGRELMRRTAVVNRVLTNSLALDFGFKYLGEGNAALRRQGKVRCRNCDKVDDIGGEEEIRDGICEDCSDRFVYCEVCCCQYHDESTCRHLFWNDGWDGCGYSHFGDKEPFAHVKPSFFFLLTRFARYDASHHEFAHALSRALLNHKYTMRLWGFLLGMPNFDCYLDGEIHNFGWRATEDLDDFDLELQSLGGSWLMSLEAGRTPYADIITSSWCWEWMALTMQSQWENSYGATMQGTVKP